MLVLANAIPEPNPAAEGETDCKIEGDEGLYGIGVRLGIYFQVFASMFTLAFQRDQGPAFLYAAAALQAALFVALVYASVRREIHSSEAVMALMLLIIMVLFECLVMISIFIHLLSGHFRLALNEEKDLIRERPQRTRLQNRSISAEGLQEGVIDSQGNDRIRKSTERSEKAASDSGTFHSSQRSDTSDLGLSRQKTRRTPYTKRAKLDLREAIYASNPLLIDDDVLALMARTVGNYSESHIWASGALIVLLMLGSYIYLMWFWWTGLFQLETDPCGSRAFLVVATLEIDHWVRWPMRVGLLVAGIFLLGFLLQGLCLIVGFICIFVFQFCEVLTGWLVRRSEAAQKMKHFFDRVTVLQLPLVEEYLLILLVYKAFLSHWPDRVFLSLFGKDPQKEIQAKRRGAQSQDESISVETVNISIQETDPRRKIDNAEQGIEGPHEGPQDFDGQGIGLRSEIRQTNEPERLIDLPKGAKVRASEFFEIGRPIRRNIIWSNKICSRLLKPRLTSSTALTSGETVDTPLYIMPFEDNFETITIPLIILCWHIFYFVVIGILLAAGIWSVELTIQKNHIEDVNNLPSAAQLTPFVIGVGSFCMSGISALGALGTWLLQMGKLRRGSSSWFDAIVDHFFYEARPEQGGVDIEYMRQLPWMLVIWMLFPTLRKGEDVGNFEKEFGEKMKERGGFFVLDLFD